MTSVRSKYFSLPSLDLMIISRNVPFFVSFLISRSKSSKFIGLDRCTTGLPSLLVLIVTSSTLFSANCFLRSCTELSEIFWLKSGLLEKYSCVLEISMIIERMLINTEFGLFRSLIRSSNPIRGSAWIFSTSRRSKFFWPSKTRT